MNSAVNLNITANHANTSQVCMPKGGRSQLELFSEKIFLAILQFFRILEKQWSYLIPFYKFVHKSKLPGNQGTYYKEN